MGYNGRYGSNPQGIREISDDLFQFDHVGRWIDDRNWGEMVFYERGLENESTESKINEFDFDFAEKLKIEERWYFQKCKSWFYWNYDWN